MYQKPVGKKKSPFVIFAYMSLGRKEIRLDHQQTDGKVARFDAGRTGEVVRLDNGFLRVPATLGNTGVLKYRKADGTLVRELRLPEELFKPESLRSLEMVPVTNDHPGGDGFVHAYNARDLQKGHVGDRITHTDAEIQASLMITDAQTVSDVDGGKREVSPGYLVRLDFTPGVHPEYGPYDAIQRDIEYNHVAIVAAGRAGPQVALHLDSAMEVTASDNYTQPTEKTTMETIMINGVSVEVSKQAAQAYAVEKAASEAKLDSLASEKSALEAKLDASQAELEKAKTAHADAADPAKVAEVVKSRVELISAAAPVLKKDMADLVSVEDAEIKRQVVIAVHPNLAEKVAKADSAYLDVAYDMALEAHVDSDDKDMGAVNAAGNAPQVKLDSGADIEALRKQAHQKRLDHIKAQNEAWKKPLMSSEGQLLNTNAQA